MRQMQLSRQILTGKAIARAVRAHLLVDAAVNTLLVSKALKISIPGLQNTTNDPPSVDHEDEPCDIGAEAVSNPGLQDTSNDPPSAEDEPYNLEADAASNEPPSDYGRENCDLEEARICFDDLMNKRKSAEDVSAADVLTRIKHFLHEKMDVMKNDRTALL